MEIYKDISELKGHYQVSNLGNVKSLKRNKELILKAKTDRYGYKSLGLYKGGKIKHYTVHRLVAQAFISNPKNKTTVNHKNGIKDDNRLENLEWMTVQENTQHGFDVLGRKLSESHLNALRRSQRKKVVQYDINGNFIKEYKGMRAAERETGFNGIGQVCLGQRNSIFGYKFKYI